MKLIVEVPDSGSPELRQQIVMHLLAELVGTYHYDVSLEVRFA